MEVLQLMRSAERLGGIGGVELMIAAMRSAILIFSNTNAYKYIVIFLDFLKMCDSISEAKRRLIANTVFTKKLPSSVP